MNIIRLILITCLSAWLLTSCASIQTPAEPPQNQLVAWNERVQTLSSINDWDLKGLIAIRSISKNNNWSAHWQWQQGKDTYNISLVGPLGSGALKLSGVPHNVTLDTSDGKHFTAPTAETLLEQQLGWRLPVSNLYYWVRGLPVPNVHAEKQFDAYNHLTLLRQGDWVIQYLRYTSIHRIDVPNKIYLTNSDLDVKIIVNQWRI